MNATIGALLEFKGSRVYTVSPATTVADAVTEMNQRNIGSLAVVDGMHLVGMFTSRDVMRKVVPAMLDTRTALVRDFMHSDYPVLSKNMSADDALDVFERFHFRHLPILDEGRLEGVLSIGDLSRWCATASRIEAESLKQYIHTGLPG